MRLASEVTRSQASPFSGGMTGFFSILLRDASGSRRPRPHQSFPRFRAAHCSTGSDESQVKKAEKINFVDLVKSRQGRRHSKKLSRHRRDKARES